MGQETLFQVLRSILDIVLQQDGFEIQNPSSHLMEDSSNFSVTKRLGGVYFLDVITIIGFRGETHRTGGGGG